MSRLDKLKSFAIVSDAILEDERVTTTQLAVFTAICKFADKNGIAYPSTKKIAKLAKCTKATAINAIKKLEELGYIQVSRNKKSDKKENEVNRYKINDYPESYQQGGITVIPRGIANIPGVVSQLYRNKTNLTKPSNIKNIYNSDIQNLAIRVVDYINIKANTFYENNKLITTYVSTLLENNFTEEDIKRVIDNKINKTNSLDVEPTKILNLNYFKKVYNELDKKKVVVPINLKEM